MNNNLEIIKLRFPDGYRELQKYMETRQPDDSVIVEGDIIGKVQKETLYYMTSSYDSAAAGEIWAAQFQDIKYKEVFFVFGMGNLSAIKALLDRLGPANIVIVYEPDPEIYVHVLENMDVTEVLSDDRFLIAADGINTTHLLEYLKIAVPYAMLDHCRIASLPNYDRMYPDVLDKMVNMITRYMETEKCTANTYKQMSRMRGNRNLYALWETIDSMTVDQLVARFTGVDIEGVPAIIVAAGPSLDKNIDELKAAVGKAFIIAADSAVRKLIKHGIIPDIFVTVDFIKPESLMDDETARKIPVLSCMGANCYLLEKHEGRKIMYATNNYIVEKYKEYGKKIGTVETGGSVTNNAFSLARMLGFGTVIICGQDLCYTENRGHASDTYDDRFEILEDFFETEDMYGNKVYTEANMLTYKRWFEEKIRIDEKLHFINATEGGLYINGAEHITLKEAVERECKQEVNFKEIIDSIPDTFTEEEKEDFRQYYIHLDKNAQELQGIVKSGLRDYRKLKELLVKGKLHTGEYKRTYEKVKENNSRLDGNILMEIVAIYAKESEYDVLDDVYGETGDELSEWRFFIDKGIHMLEAYEDALEKFLIMHDFVLKRIGIREKTEN